MKIVLSFYSSHAWEYHLHSSLIHVNDANKFYLHILLYLYEAVYMRNSWKFIGIQWQHR